MHRLTFYYDTKLMDALEGIASCLEEHDLCLEYAEGGDGFVVYELKTKDEKFQEDLEEMCEEE